MGFPGDSNGKKKKKEKEKLSAVWETGVQSLDEADPLEKGTTTHSNILAWRISWTEESGRLPAHRVILSLF